MKTRLHRSPLAAHIAMMLAITLVLGSSTAFAAKRPGGGGGGGGSTGTTTKPPTPTNFRVTAITAYTISVAWDAAPATSLDFNLLYRSDYPRNVIATTLRFLDPDTTYAVQIRTIDFGGNPSPLSDPVAFTTLPANPNDTTSPTVPANVFAYGFGDLEMQLSWEQSTDDFDAQANIRYDVYVNGRFEDVVFGSGGPRVIYGTAFGENVIEVFATDTAGNTSAAGTFTIFL